MKFHSAATTLVCAVLSRTTIPGTAASGIRGGKTDATGEQQSRRVAGSDGSFTLDIIDDMYKHFGSSGTYNPNFQSELISCMGKWDDPSLALAADDQWRAMVSYYEDPVSKDPWLDCLEKPSQNFKECKESKYAEGQQDMASFFGDGTAREMVIEEPCNYASNIAYYHGAIRMCNRQDEEWSGGNSNMALRKSLKQSFVTLASGSAFCHGSNTRFGGLYDTLPISTIAYISYESLIAAIGGSDKLRCLGMDTCARAEDVARQTSFASLDHSLELDDNGFTNLHNELIRINGTFPSEYATTFGATVAIAAHISFPEYVAKEIVDSLAGKFDEGGALKNLLYDQVLAEAVRKSAKRSVSSNFRVFVAHLLIMIITGTPDQAPWYQ